MFLSLKYKYRSSEEAAGSIFRIKVSIPHEGGNIKETLVTNYQFAPGYKS